MTSPGRWARLACALVFIVSATTGCDVGKAVGQILADALEPVQAAIAQAGTVADGLAMTAAGQVELLIYQAQSAFGDILNKGINQVNEDVKSDLNKISQLADSLATSAAVTLEQTRTDATQLLNQLPFTNKNPQVTSYTPNVTTGAKAKDGLTFVIRGNFFGANDPHFAPTLKVNGQVRQASLVTSTTTQLGFRLPPGIFPSITSGFSAPDIEVDLPYEKGTVFKKTVPGQFHFLITTLPDSPVRGLTLFRTHPGPPKQLRDPHPEYPAEHRYVSSLNCHSAEGSIIGVPRDGWSIDVNSVKIHVDYAKGGSGEVEGPYLQSLSPTGFVALARTHPAAVCTWPIFEGGRVRFFVSYDEVQTVPTGDVDDPPQTLTLNWGDRRSEPVPQNPGHWRMVAVLFDGTELDAPPDVAGNKYLKITDVGDHVAFQATDLDQIDLSSIR